MRKVNIPIFVPHLGCRHACVFCNQKRITGSSGEVDADTVRRIVDEALATIAPQTCQTAEIAFFGGSFTAIDIRLQRQLLNAAFSYVKDRRVHGIRLSTRPDCIDRDILTMLAEYGVTAIELGVQSTDDAVLSLCGRGHTSADVRFASGLIHEYGFALGHQMMVGLPGSVFQSEMQTASDIASMRPACVRVYPTLVIKDSPLAGSYRAGQYTPLALDEAVARCAALAGLFEASGIAVIRMGLMENDGLSLGKGLVAGPYHPAFGELVRSHIYLKRMRDMLGSYTQDKAVLYVHPAELSKAIGNNRRNIRAIFDELGVNLSIKPCKNVEAGSLVW